MNANYQEQQVIETMWARLWRVTVLFGLIALALGLFALLNPQATAALPIQLLGGFIVLDGLYKMGTAVFKRQRNWGTRLSGGAVEIIMGLLIVAFASEIVTAAFTVLLYLVGFGLLIGGGLSVLHAMQRRDWTNSLTGLLLLGLGVLMFALTGPVAISLVWMTGIFLISVGVLLLVVGFRMRQQGRVLSSRMQGDVIEGKVIEGEIVEELPKELADGRDAVIGEQ